MVRQVRRLTAMRGSGVIAPVAAEAAVRDQRHRCLIARQPIAAGDVFTAINVGLKRPVAGSVGLSPASYNAVLGKNAACAIVVDQPISQQDVQGFV